MGPDLLYFSDDSDSTTSSVDDFVGFASVDGLASVDDFASVDGFDCETKISSSVDGFGGFPLGITTCFVSFVEIVWFGLFFVLKRLKGSGRSESDMSSGFVSHCEVTVAPTCFEAGWSLPHTEVGDVSTLHLCKKAHSVPFVQPFWLK